MSSFVEEASEVKFFEFFLGVVVDESMGTFFGEILSNWVVGNN